MSEKSFNSGFRAAEQREAKEPWEPARSLRDLAELIRMAVRSVDETIAVPDNLVGILSEEAEKILLDKKQEGFPAPTVITNRTGGRHLLGTSFQKILMTDVVLRITEGMDNEMRETIDNAAESLIDSSDFADAQVITPEDVTEAVARIESRGAGASVEAVRKELGANKGFVGMMSLPHSPLRAAYFAAVGRKDALNK